MTIHDLYSYRNRVSKENESDVYKYDSLPAGLRAQIVHIWDQAIGQYDSFPNSPINQAWDTIHMAVAREHGVLQLVDGCTPEDQCKNYLLKSEDQVDRLLDLIEYSFWCIHKNIDQLSSYKKNRFSYMGKNFGEVTSDDVIKELNGRFQRACVGYGFESGRIVRIDSELIHSEIVKPALRLLNGDGFEGPQNEFLKAHEHYRHGRNKEAVTFANNAYESMLKVICDHKGWEYETGATAAELYKVVRKNGLLPDYLDRSFDQLASSLKSGLPKVRGREGSHGQGKTPRHSPEYIAGYAIHLAAANILFLYETYKHHESSLQK